MKHQWRFLLQSKSGIIAERCICGAGRLLVADSGDFYFTPGYSDALEYQLPCSNPPSPLDQPLPFSSRINEALKEANILNLGDLLRTGYWEFAEIPGIGRQSLKKIHAYLDRLKSS